MSFHSRLIAIFFLSALPFAASAAAYEISLDNRVVPYSKIRKPHPGTFEENVEVRVQNVRLNMNVPLTRTQKSSWNTGFNYEYYSFNYRNWDFLQEPSRVDELHAIGLNLSYWRDLTDPWSLRAFARPSVNSDLKGFSGGRAIRLQGGVVWVKDLSGRGNLGLGIVLINNYGTPQVFPGISYDRTVGFHRFEVRVPTQIRWNYCPKTPWTVGFGLQVAGNNFRLEESGGFDNMNVRYSVGLAGPNFEYQWKNGLILTLEAGYSFQHTFEILDGRDRIRDYDLDNVPYASMGLKYRVGESHRR